jgi:hypothetical protein
MKNASPEFDVVLPLACAWVEEQERLVLRNGVPLPESLMADARTAGVAHPERVRILCLPQVPIPTHPVLRAVCDATKAITERTHGLCVRYGIFVRSERWGQRDLVVHELVHTAQYERLGGIQPFLDRYLRECVTVGYPQGAMEQEAIVTAAKICNAGP